MDTQKHDKTESKKLCIACKREFSAEHTTCPHDGTALTPLSMEYGIGSVVADKYEILAVIGGGAMGLVYKVRHTLMKRIVALKVLHPNMVPDAATVQRFQKEAEALSCLNHPNILTVFDFGMNAQGQPYLVTDYLEGETLAAVLEKSKRIDCVRALKIFSQVASALAHAHKNGVIHRDLKPSNIMLVQSDDQKDFVKILDFGIAKVITEDGSESNQLTRTGEVFGSPLYMSPEQCRGKKLGPRSDIYSFGCVMYRSLAGQPPLFGQDLVECLYKHVNEAPPPFSETAPELAIPPAVEALVMKCLAKNPDDRYQSMAELKDDLDAIAGEEELNGPPAQVQAADAAEPDTGTLKVDLKAASKETGERQPESSGDKPASEAQANEAASEAAEQAPAAKPAKDKEQTVPDVHVNGALDRTLDKLTEKKVVIGIVAVALVIVGIPVVVRLASGPETVKPVEPPELQKVPVSPYKDKMQKGIEEYEEGNYHESISAFESALAMAKKEKDSKDRVAAALHHLIAACAEAKEFDQAQSYLSDLKKVAGLKSVTSKPDSLEAAEALYDHAALMLLSSPKDISKAQTMLQNSLDYYESHDNTAAETMRCLSKLGQIAILEGKFAHASSLMSQAVTIAKEDPTVSELEMAQRMDQCGDAYILLAGKSRDGAQYYADAQKMYEEALKLRRDTLKNENHLAMAQSYLKLGVLYYLKDQYDKSLESLKRSLAIRQTEPHPIAVAEVEIAISYVYLKQKKIDEAEKAFSDAIESAKKAGPAANNLIAKWKSVFAQLKRQAG